MQIYRGGFPSFSGNIALAIACLVLFIPSYGFDFLHIYLLGAEFKASFFLTVKSLFQAGFPFVAGLVLFCGVIAPLLICCSVTLIHLSLHYRHYHQFRIALKLVELLKTWVMIDVFLVSVAIACFKLRDYAEIFASPALYSFVLLQFLSVILLGRVNVRRYWEQWQQRLEPSAHHQDQLHHSFYRRKLNSIQKSWALLCTAAICIIPANLLPISVLFSNNTRLEDTIFSGVISLVNHGMAGIAVIIFIASILVPMIKILGLGYLLIAIQYRHVRHHWHRMLLYFLLKWIGKWSMIDLFVIAIMMTLVDRGQLFNFEPGPGAIAFGMVVVFTMLATQQFDPRLIWDTYPSTPQRNLNES
jgi:paraquat-inducible protein A